MNFESQEAPQKIASGRVLSVDYGHARIGLAVSDIFGIMGNALDTIPGDKKPERAAKKIHEKIIQFEKEKGYKIGTVVIGLPLHLKGVESERSKEVRTLVQALEKLAPNIQCVLFDERLTSLQAERAMKELGQLSRKERAQKVDSISALILLQSYLDSISIKKTF